jgi:2-iminobutanoate/2-iminopropanoate deaminase
MAVQHINVAEVARLPAFCHATIAGPTVYVAGMLGCPPGGLELIEGGVGPQTTQALQNIGTVLAACGASFDDVVKVNVYLTDMSAFDEMNQAYLAQVGDNPPARITVGCTALALGAAVELDCIAYLGG